MIVGMDFGTTNSGMAVYDGQQLRLLPLDPEQANPRVLRTALYIGNDQNVVIGRQAIDRFFTQNLDRPVKLEQVWVGEIEVRGADMYYVRDAYIWTDVFSPGRLFLSIKSALRDREYAGTVVGPFFFALEDLVATFLYLARLRAQKLLNQELSAIVLGRPVRFALDPQADALAQARLLEAAFRAGYRQVGFQYEPVAAAYHYASTLERPENVLVFDFGGGTLDLTVMRLAPAKPGHDPGETAWKHQVLATGGIPVAGDVFDQKIIRAKLPAHFGEGTSYGPRHKTLPTPAWIYDMLANWQTVMELQTPQNRQVLEEIAATARRPREIQALISLVSSNHALRMFDVVEETKRELSERLGGMIKLVGPGFKVHQLLTRSEFEAIIHTEIEAIRQHLAATLAEAGLAPPAVDAVIRTGGSAEIPAFRRLLDEMFSPDRVRHVDTFSSVTAGLGITAHALEMGRLDLKVYTPEDQPARSETRARESGRVNRINLALVRRRLEAAELLPAEETGAPATALVLLSADWRLSVQALPAGALEDRASVALPQALSAPTALQAALPVTLDEPLLLVTSHYRFLPATARQLLDLAELELGLGDLHPLRTEEAICEVVPWARRRESERLVLVTMPGYARTYQTSALRERLEGPVPLAFDEPLPGWPYRLLGGSRSQDLLLATARGRLLRRPLSSLPGRGAQVMAKERDDGLVAAHVIRPESELILLNQAGFGRRAAAEQVEASTGSSKGRVALSRGEVQGVAVSSAGGPAGVWAVTNRFLRRLDPTELPLETSTRAHQALRLPAGEFVVGLLDTYSRTGAA